MYTQQDTKTRLLALENLRAMCERVSSTCHYYQITKVTRSRVHVTYNNPDEYGNDNPITAVFPCYPSNWTQDDSENPRVILDPLRLTGEGADWDMFWLLESCPSLYRDYPNGCQGEARWESHADILKRQGKTEMENHRADGSCQSCQVCDVKGGK